MGDGNASIPTPQPVIARSMFGGYGAALDACSVHFVSRAGHRRRRARRAVAAAASAVRGCRTIGKRDLVLQRRAAADRGGRRHLRGPRRRRAADVRAGRRAAAGAAVFPVLSGADVLHVFQIAAGRATPCSRARRCRLPPSRIARDTITLGWEERLKARGRRRRTAASSSATALPRGTVLRGGDCFVLDEPRRRRRGRRAAGAGVRRSSRGRRRNGALFALSHRQQPSAADARRRRDRLSGRAGHGAGARLSRASRSSRDDAAVHAGRSALAPDTSHRAPAMSPVACVALLHLCDSLFPIGAFAHSDGLEAATASGRVATASDLRAWMDALPATKCSARCEGPAVCAAPGRRSRAATGPRCRALDDEVHALRPSSAARQASRAMGTRLLTTWQRIHPDRRGCSVVAAASARGDARCRSRSASSAPRRGDRPARRRVEAFVYTRLAATVSAAMRLMPIGQHEAHALLADALDARAGGGRRRDRRRGAPAASFAPAIDIAAMSQQYVHSRLFRS